MSESSTLKELQKISKILILVNAPAIERELSKITVTDERKKMWVLVNGKTMPKDIATEAGATPMSVSRFLNAGIAAGLLEYNKGKPPIRILDYVPPSWTEFLKAQIPEEPDGPLQTKLGSSNETTKSGEK